MTDPPFKRMRPGGVVPPFKRKGNPWRFGHNGNPVPHRDGIPNHPYRQPSKKRQRYVQQRTGLTPAQQADWCLAVVDIRRLMRRTATPVKRWITKGRRRRSELTYHRLPHEDYGIGDESRWYTRMQDLVLWAIEWNMTMYIMTPQDELMLQRARTAILLTHGYDPIPLLKVIRPEQESEAIQ